MSSKRAFSLWLPATESISRENSGILTWLPITPCISTMATLERRLILKSMAGFSLLESDHQANCTLPRDCDEIGNESEELPWRDAE